MTHCRAALVACNRQNCDDRSITADAKSVAKSCLQTRKQSVLKGVLRLNNAAAARLLWDTAYVIVETHTTRYASLLFRALPSKQTCCGRRVRTGRICFGARRKSEDIAGLFRGLATQRRSKYDPFRPAFFQPQHPLIFSVLALRKCEGELPCVASAFHLAKNEKSSA